MVAALRRHGVLILVLVAAGAIYSTTLNAFGMFMWDEAEYASLARSVLRGDGFTVGGKPDYLRPPLLPLAGAASIWAHGEANDLAVKRATVALTLIALALVYVVTGATFDRTTALLAAFLLATTPELWTMTAGFLSEIPFLGFFVAAVLGFDLGLRQNPRWFWFSWVGWSLALLTRYNAILFGPFVLLRLAIGLLIRRADEWPRVRTSSFLLAPLVGLLLVIPWLVRQQISFGDALIGFKAAAHQLQDYVPGVSMPWYFYLQHLSDMMSPATSLLLLFGVICAVQRRDGVSLVCTSMIAGLLLWFSVYRYKEVRLATSILPFAAIVAATGIAQSLRGRWRWILAPLAVAIFFWNEGLVRPIFSQRIALGYPALLESLQFLREHTSKDATVMAASRPQAVWYVDRRTVDFPEPDEFVAAIQDCEWVVFTSFERSQKPYVLKMAKQLATLNLPGEVVQFNDPRFSALVARSQFLLQHLKVAPPS